MIHGHKPNGYITTFDASGKKIEGETRMCVHCQKMWTYTPGSGVTRGWCLDCDGFICAEPQCLLQQQQITKKWLDQTGKVRNCIPLEEWNNRRVDKLAHLLPLDPNLTVTASGLIVPRKPNA